MIARAILLGISISVVAAPGRLDAAVFQGPIMDGSIDDALRTADSLRIAGDLPAARRLAESLEDRRPRDPRVLMLLGRIHLAWPRVGRFAAESLLARAARIDSTNPEPCYYIADVGAALGGEDGDEMTHAGLLCAIGRNPDYRDAWDRWTRVYHNPDRRRAMITALARSPRSSVAAYRRGQLLVELDRGHEGAALLAEVLSSQPRDAGVLAWLARALYLDARADEAATVYDRAMDHADNDTGDVLWKQIRGITTPEERRIYATTPRDQRPSFYRLFWARRNDDLAASLNGRIGEHFRRLNYAIRHYSLLYPHSRYFRSELYRALAGSVGGMPDLFNEAGAAFVFASDEHCGERRSGSARTQSPQLGTLPRIDTTGAGPLNREYDLDDRGMIYLRHGEPQTRLIGPRGVAESWCYVSRGRDVLRTSFMRRTGGQAGTGDYVLTAMIPGEAEAARELLVTDHGTAPADLSFEFWRSTFRADSGRTELVLVSDSLDALAALLDGEGREADRRDAPDGIVRLSAAPGRYILMLDAHREGHENRFRGPVQLSDYGGERAAISSILVAPGETPATRDAMIAAAPRHLELPATEAFRVYAELYNVGRSDSSSRYEVSYAFERLDGFVLPGGSQREVVITFQRESTGSPRLIESLVVDPGRIPAGRYRLRVAIRDQVRDTGARSAAIEFRLH